MWRHPISILAWFIAAAGTVGCEGEVVVPDLPDLPDMAMTLPDIPGSPDMMTDRDEGMQPDPLCIGVTCQANAICGRGECWCAPGFMGDPNAGCTPGNPCEGVECDFGATCVDTGVCVCDIGFDETLNGCEATPIEFPLDRTEEEICARWSRDYPETAGLQWQVEPADQCSEGELDPAFQLDAVRRVSLYRWLVGLRAVTTTQNYMTWTQACATALDAQNVGATNEVTADFTCFSGDAETGAAASSILRAAPSAAAAVDTFIEDAAAASLGNRRWILNPGMGATSFGFRGDYACMYATDANGIGGPQYIAYPFGVFPQQALRGRWMWASAQLFSDDTTTVTVMDAGGGNVAVSNLQRFPPAVFPAALAWDVATTEPGDYTVTLQGLSGALNELTYPVTIVACP